MSIILKSKSNKRDPGFSGVAGFNLDDLANRASQELDQAQQSAAAIIKQAHADAEAIQKQAREAGREEGLKDANEVIDQRVKVAVDTAVHSRLATLESTIDELWQTEQEWLQQWQRNTLEIAFEIAQKLTRHAIQNNDDILIAWANEALDAVRGARKITLAVHPETLSVLGQQLDRIVRRPGLPQETHIEPDETVEPMGVVVRQEGGHIDLQLSTQMETLAQHLGLKSDDQ
ncbi:flagellar assembly protein H [Rosistilla carotiformis]|uniref:Flagellar assembly protein FliH n=1 Tax=Rosistilla carotiformis TaxID=2528017 RepID=A0A518JN06_9BACT|nr:FliH/SctL family protein [Rosistilla carotiformis]QDV66933.1 flagellar assembly protein H [Rosistilla carotiformis]